MSERGPLYALFRDEMARHAAALVAGLRGLAERPGGEPGAALTLATHSIRGAARVVGVAAAERLAGELEECLSALERTKATLAPPAVATLVGGAEALARLGEVPASEIDAWMAEHRAELDEVAAAVLSLTTSLGRPARREKREEPKGQTLELFRLEAEVHAATLTEGLLLLEREPQRLDVIDRMMRAAHSLKGAARVVGLDAAVTLAHAIEDHLTQAQRRGRPLTPAAVDVLLSATDLLLARAEATRRPEAGGGPTDADALALAAHIAELEGSPDPVDTGPAPAAPATVATAATVAAAPPPAALAAREGPAESDRVLRVKASHLTRLVGLSGESLVEARRLRPFADLQHRLRGRQAGLADLVNELHQTLGAPPPDDPIGVRIAEIRSRITDCRELVAQWVEGFEEHARRSEDLTLRLFREATASRMRPLGDGLAAFPRMVRDVAKKLGKKAELVITGEEREIDRDILEKIEAPLNHLLRNAVDHGLETPAERRAAGKPEQGTVRIEARPRAGMLEVSIGDDGRGIDEERVRQKVVALGLLPAADAAVLDAARLLDYVFAPGFSTAAAVTEISGRGVGLDVVQSVLHEVGGNVHVTSEKGRGATFHLRVPISRSVIRAVVVAIAGEPYAFPLTRIDRLLSVPLAEISLVQDRQYVMVDGRSVALVPTAQVLELDGGPPPADPVSVVVVSDRAQRLGFVVDRFVGEYDLVVRPLDPRLGRVADISAAAILPDGAPVLIVDVEDLARSVMHLQQLTRIDKVAARLLPAERRAKRILVVDDSITVRELERQLLLAKGYDVSVAVDGVDGWTSVRENAFDLVITDVDMPRMDGIALTRSIKQDPRLKSLPVMIVSFRDGGADRARGLEAAADFYLTKGEFQDDVLLRAVHDLIGGPETT